MKEILDSIIENICIPLYREIQNRDEFKNIAKDENSMLKIETLFASLAYSIIIHKNNPSVISKIDAIFKKNKMDEKNIIKLIDIFSLLLIHWANNHIEKEVNFKEYLDILKKYFISTKEDQKELLIFEEADDDELIDRDHFLREDKIEAEGFMRYSAIDEDLERDLRESIEDFEMIDSSTKDISYEYIQKVINVIKYFILAFKHDGEFQKINEALIRFMDEIPEYDIDDLSEDERILLREFISNFIKDMIKYIKIVIFEKSTYDINYLDASINAAVLQLELVLNND